MSDRESFSQSWARLPGLAKANLLALMAFALLLCLVLWPAWTRNPDLSHGLFMPAIFLLLLYESRAGGPRRFLSGGAELTAAVAATAAAGLATLFISGMYATVLDWSNAAVLFSLACALSLLLGAALITFADKRIRLVPFNWTSFVAVCLWPLSAPIPPGTYSRLTVALQLLVSSNVLRALHFFGVPAYRTGNIIELANTTVGVEEACSGVRSLVSCLFVGIFFSASLVKRPWARVLIIALSPLLAIAMNFVRSLTLTLLANSGVNIRGAWHDITGYSILIVTAAITGGLALWLGRDTAGKPAAKTVPQHDVDREKTAATPVSQAVIAGTFALAAALVMLFYANTRPSVRRNAPVPDLWAAIPETADGWAVTTTRDLYQFKDTLQTDLLAQRIYKGGNPQQPTSIVLYLAYWRAGQAPVSLVASHTPEACWPGSGWVPQALPQSRESLTIGGRPLPPVEARLFTNRDYPQYVWFWHLYDGRTIAYQNPYSLRELLSIAWHYGFRHNGDQLFVRVSSNRPWEEIAPQPFLRAFFSNLQPQGL